MGETRIQEVTMFTILFLLLGIVVSARCGRPHLDQRDSHRFAGR